MAQSIFVWSMYGYFTNPYFAINNINTEGFVLMQPNF